MAHWVKPLAAQLDNLSLIPRTRMEGRTSSHKLLGPPHTCCGMCAIITHIHKINKLN